MPIKYSELGIVFRYEQPGEVNGLLRTRVISQDDAHIFCSEEQIEEELREHGIEDPVVFGMEKHLEDFLVQNWRHTELGKHYDIYEEDGEIVGQQYPSDSGPIDILAISKDKKIILVVELKKGRIGDVVVGQIQRYMGYVKEELAEKNQEVKGVIIAFEDDAKIHRALSVAPNIDFYTYKIHFELEKK